MSEILKELKSNNILWKESNIWKYDLEKLIEYLINISPNFTNYISLCKYIGVYEDFLKNLEKKENIKLDLNFKVLKNNANFKSKYQDYDWCYDRYITKGMSHEEMAEEANCTKRVICKWCCEKHRITRDFRKVNLELNELQRNILIGSMLGDGHIDKREEQPMFIEYHAINQKDYIFWKYYILKNLCNKEPVFKDSYYRVFPNGKEYKCQEGYRLSTRIQFCLKEIRDMTKRELISKLNNLSLCVFILDDACRDTTRWSLCLADIELEDREYFVKIMKDRFNLNCTISNHDNRYVNFKAESTRKIDRMILDNIPNDLDIIKSKILRK